jgi:outer membrane protein assembly factor BamB
MKIIQFPLFCNRCNNSLVPYKAQLITLTCPKCGFTNSTLLVSKVMNLLFDHNTTYGIETDEKYIYSWGTNNTASEIHRVHLLSLQIEIIFTCKNNWKIESFTNIAKSIIFIQKEYGTFNQNYKLTCINKNRYTIDWEIEYTSFFLTNLASDESILCFVDSNGQIIAIDPYTHETIWNENIKLLDYPHQGIEPVISKTFIFNVQPKKKGGGLLAINRSNGQISWTFQPPNGVMINFAPTIYGDFLYIIAGKYLFRVSIENGDWEYLYQAERKSSQGWFFNKPIVDKNTIYLFDSSIFNEKVTYYFKALNQKNKSIIWQLAFNKHPHSIPIIEKQYLFITNREGYLLAVNKTNGEILWKENLHSECTIAPIKFKNKIYLFTKDLSIYRIDFPDKKIKINSQPNEYKKNNEYFLAAAKYLSNNQPFDAGLCLLYANDLKQADLAFQMLPKSDSQIIGLYNEYNANHEDNKAGELAECYGNMLLLRWGYKSRHNLEIAVWYKKAIYSYESANNPIGRNKCTYYYNKLLENPIIHIGFNKERQWVNNTAINIPIKLTNIGFGPAKELSVYISGSITNQNPIITLSSLLVSEIKIYENSIVIPNMIGEGIIIFTVILKNYRSNKKLKEIVKFPIIINSNRKDEMDIFSLIVSALVAGITTGATDSIKAISKQQYINIKEHLLSKNKDNTNIIKRFEAFERQPEVKLYQEELRNEITKLNIENDITLLELCKNLLPSVNNSNNIFNINFNSQINAIENNYSKFSPTQNNNKKD